MKEFPCISEVIVNYINSQQMIEFCPELHHSLIEDLAFDSLDIIELSIHLEDMYDISIDDRQLYRNAITLGDLIEMIKYRYNLL